jgi:hypothetical protein
VFSYDYDLAENASLDASVCFAILRIERFRVNNEFAGRWSEWRTGRKLTSAMNQRQATHGYRIAGSFKLGEGHSLTPMRSGNLAGATRARRCVLGYVDVERPLTRRALQRFTKRFRSRQSERLDGCEMRIYSYIRLRIRYIREKYFGDVFEVARPMNGVLYVTTSERVLRD